MRYIKAFFVWIWLLFAQPKEDKKEFTPFLRLNLQTFAEDPKDPPTDPPADPPKTFNQDDVNKIVQDRVSRAEKKAQKELAKQLGFESVEEMQKALDKSKKKDPPKKEDPVDVDAVVEAKLKEQLKAEQDKTFKRLVNAEVKVLANELGFADWEDALALADLSQVKEDEKGNIAGVKEALEALKTKKPHLLKQTQLNQFGVAIPNNQQQRKESLENIKKAAASRGVQQTQAHNPWA